MRSSGEFAGNLPHVERYFSKGHWCQPIEDDQSDSTTAENYGRPISRSEIEAGNQELALWKQANGANGGAKAVAL